MLPEYAGVAVRGNGGKRWPTSPMHLMQAPEDDDLADAEFLEIYRCLPKPKKQIVFV